MGLFLAFTKCLCWELNQWGRESGQWGRGEFLIASFIKRLMTAWNFPLTMCQVNLSATSNFPYKYGPVNDTQYMSISWFIWFQCQRVCLSVLGQSTTMQRLSLWNGSQWRTQLKSCEEYYWVTGSVFSVNSRSILKFLTNFVSQYMIR